MFHAKFLTACSHIFIFIFLTSVHMLWGHVTVPQSLFTTCTSSLFLSACRETGKITKHFHLLPPPTMDRTLNNTSAGNLCTKWLVPPCIEMASVSIFSLDRHGKSSACSHLWAGRSHWAPEGKWQSQVLSRVRGRSADYLSLKNFWCRFLHLASHILFHSFAFRCVFIEWYKIKHILRFPQSCCYLYKYKGQKLKLQAQREFAWS